MRGKELRLERVRDGTGSQDRFYSDMQTHDNNKPYSPVLKNQKEYRKKNEAGSFPLRGRTAAIAGREGRRQEEYPTPRKVPPLEREAENRQTRKNQTKTNRKVSSGRQANKSQANHPPGQHRPATQRNGTGDEEETTLKSKVEVEWPRDCATTTVERTNNKTSSTTTTAEDSSSPRSRLVRTHTRTHTADAIAKNKLQLQLNWLAQVQLIFFLPPTYADA